jgi:hypothetical protein
MKHTLLLLGLLALFGCDSQANRLDDASAVISIDGKQTQALASLVTKELGGELYQAVLIETTAHDQIEILGLSFEQGKFVKQNEANVDFPYVISYREAVERPRAYMASSGSLELVIATTNALEGEFDFETIDGLSSCMECEAAKGPKVSGRFRAMRSD